MRIAVAGYGIEGRSNYSYWTNLGYEVDILDENEHVSNTPSEARVVLGESVYQSLGEYDFVVRTAGLNPAKLGSANKVWSATNEFFAKCPAPIIGVTGSKGKGTTSSLIHSILKADGRKAHLVGNIGVPALDSLSDIAADDVVVYEMSSFQLWDIERSPQVAVVLHIEPDHLDVHADFEDYIQAKANIVRYQSESDVTIVHPTNQFSLKIAEQRQVGSAGVVRYGDRGQSTQIPFSYAENGNFLYGYGEKQGKVICSVDKLQLPGVHNVDNANAAITAALQFGVSAASIATGLEAFKGLNHRLKLVAEVDGVKYFDDSIATTPGSAIAAARAFSEPKIMILGGSPKGADFSELASVLVEVGVKRVILIGSEAQRIEESLSVAGYPDDRISNLSEQADMQQIVGLAREQAEPGDVVLLSPACASFGQFKNYQDRGEQFIAAVENLRGEA